MNIEEIGLWIKKQRLSHGMTQQELADILFITPQAVSKWERGECLPDITLLPEIAKAFSLEIEDVLSELSSTKEIMTIDTFIQKVQAQVNTDLFDELLYSIESSQSIKEFTLPYQVFLLLDTKQRHQILTSILQVSDYPLLLEELITYLSKEEKEFVAYSIIDDNKYYLLKEIIVFLNNDSKSKVLKKLLGLEAYETIEELLPFLTREQKDLILKTGANNSNLIELLQNLYPFLDKKQKRQADLIFMKWEDLL